MKWFKHFSQAKMDAKLVMIRSEFGMWGIGVYWTLVEFVAEQMKGVSPQSVATLSMREMCSFFGCKRNKLETFLKRLQNVRGMNYTLKKDILIIDCPKLLEIKDNYHKDLEETSQTLGRNLLPEEEVEEEVEKTCAFDSSNAFDSLWKEYPRRLGKKAALRHFTTSVKSSADYERIKKALANYRAKLMKDKTEERFIQHGSTWFNNWQDWEQEPATKIVPISPMKLSEMRNATNA